jgi:hypothetical protein
VSRVPGEPVPSRCVPCNMTETQSVLKAPFKCFLPHALESQRILGPSWGGTCLRFALLPLSKRVLGITQYASTAVGHRAPGWCNVLTAVPKLGSVGSYTVLCKYTQPLSQYPVWFKGGFLGDLLPGRYGSDAVFRAEPSIEMVSIGALVMLQMF